VLLKVSPDEKRASDLITSEGGLLQSERWKELDARSRKGSRLAKSLAEKDLIKREETVSDGRTTYLLTPTNGERP
jgi:DNA-binding MarR family transcriptional regulator